MMHGLSLTVWSHERSEASIQADALSRRARTVTDFQSQGISQGLNQNVDCFRRKSYEAAVIETEYLLVHHQHPRVMFIAVRPDATFQVSPGENAAEKGPQNTSHHIVISPR